MKLIADPYEAARRAYFLLNPAETDEAWERWVGMHTTEIERGFDDFGALSLFCQRALDANPELEIGLRKSLTYAVGYFNGAEQIVKAAWLAQPASPHVPKHFARYRLQLVDGRSQFESAE
jgi:hypothetical protein